MRHLKCWIFLLAGTNSTGFDIHCLPYEGYFSKTTMLLNGKSFKLITQSHNCFKGNNYVKGFMANGRIFLVLDFHPGGLAMHGLLGLVS